MDDGLVRIWNPSGHELILSLPGPAKIGLRLSVSKEGRRLAGEFMTPGDDRNYEQIWSTEPWTREALGIDADADWKTAFEAQRLRRFKAGWGIK